MRPATPADRLLLTLRSGMIARASMSISHVMLMPIRCPVKREGRTTWEWSVRLVNSPALEPARTSRAISSATEQIVSRRVLGVPAENGNIQVELEPTSAASGHWLVRVSAENVMSSDSEAAGIELSTFALALLNRVWRIADVMGIPWKSTTLFSHAI